MGLPAMYASIYDDVATEPPYVPTCGECRWCKDLGVSGDHGVCVKRFEVTWRYEDMRVVNFDDCACVDMEE